MNTCPIDSDVSFLGEGVSALAIVYKKNYLYLPEAASISVTNLIVLLQAHHRQIPLTKS